MGGMHPQSTKNQNTRQFNLKRSIAPGGQKGGGVAQSGFQFDLNGQMVATADNDVRSLDRIMDQNSGENSLIPKRSQFNSGAQEGSKNA